MALNRTKSTHPWLVNPLKHPRLKPKNGQKLKHLFLYDFDDGTETLRIYFRWNAILTLGNVFHRCLGGSGFKFHEKKNSKCLFAIRSQWNRKPEDTPQPKHNIQPQNAPNWRSQVPGSNKKNGQQYKTHSQSDFDKTEKQSTHYSQITTFSLNNAFHWCFMLFREAILYIAYSFSCNV